MTCASPEYVARHGMPARPSDIEKHQCVLMRDHAGARHFDWEFVRGKKVIPVNASGQLMVNEVGALLAACLGGQGIAQVLDLYTRELFASGRLVQILPTWADETYPLYAYHHSAQLMSAKVRAFMDFVIELTRDPHGGRTGSSATTSGLSGVKPLREPRRISR